MFNDSLKLQGLIFGFLSFSDSCYVFVYQNSNVLVIRRFQWLISGKGKSSKLFDITVSTIYIYIYIKF